MHRAPAPADRVRDAAAAYLHALQQGRWARACALMTPAARRAFAEAAGTRCPRALAGGATLPAEQLATAARAVAGADVRVRGAVASIGPVAALPEPLRLRRVDGRWLIAG